MNQATLAASDAVELDEGTTVAEGFEAFVAPYVEKGYVYQKEQVFTVNSRAVNDDHVLKDGDRVLVFAVMAGG